MTLPIFAVPNTALERLANEVNLRGENLDHVDDDDINDVLDECITNYIEHATQHLKTEFGVSDNLIGRIKEMLPEVHLLLERKNFAQDVRDCFKGEPYTELIEEIKRERR